MFLSFKKGGQVHQIDAAENFYQALIIVTYLQAGFQRHLAKVIYGFGMMSDLV
ncbi:hypothetical protein HA050_10265 [Iodobacter sp. HSC-16F04]|uniref:Uncharacterized protein n=1 Tax=Iodobacter violaceini TaxID=3044271 RepID=A0ABX0KVK0_9NEIS|nr:hypothetical protein [Iodobacter violacea]